jgi:regulatory protein
MRKPRKVTADGLERAALHYLERFSTSRANLKRVLLGRVARSAREHGTDPLEGQAWIEALLDKLEGLGYLDDARYAGARAASLHRRGKPVHAVRFALRAKGVASDVAETALKDLADETGEPDLAAAIAFIRRKRIGPCRPPDAREAHRDKDIQAVARAGFGWEMARDLIDADGQSELDEKLEEAKRS